MTVSTVTTAAGPSTTHLAVSGTVPSSAQDSQGSESSQSSQKSQQSESSQDAANVNELQMMMVGGREKIEKMVEPMAEKLAEDIKVTGSFYKHRGRCKLCGWQAFGYEEAEVKELVKRHALQHWRDLAAGESGQTSVPDQLQGGPGGGQEQQQSEQQKADKPDKPDQPKAEQQKQKTP